MEVVIVLGGPNTIENIKALLENRYGKAYEDFRFVGVDGTSMSAVGVLQNGHFLGSTPLV